jgi:hypothetical protein
VVRRLAATADLITIRAVAPGVTLAVFAALAIPAASYLTDYEVSSRADTLQDAAPIRYLSTQPSWVHGDAPVAAGPTAFASLAGPHFEHPVSLVEPGMPCSAVRERARAGWLVLQVRPGIRGLAYDEASRCMAGVAPVVVVGQTRIYAPPRLVARS